MATTPSPKEDKVALPPSTPIHPFLSFLLHSHTLALLVGQDADKLEERLLRLVHKWAERIDESAWPQVLQTACTKFFSSAHDATSLRILKKLFTVTACEAHLIYVIDSALQVCSRSLRK